MPDTNTQPQAYPPTPEAAGVPTPPATPQQQQALSLTGGVGGGAAFDPFAPVTKPRTSWRDFQVRHDADIPGPEYIFRQGSVDFFPLNNLHCIRAEAKHGKTWVCKIFLAAAVAAAYMGIDCLMPRERRKVAFFDTEQDTSDSISVGRTVNAIARRHLDDQSDDFHTINIMDASIEQMWEALEDYLDLERPLFVVVDGCADLMKDPNDLAESKEVIRRLRVLAKQYNCAIFTVIHVNPETAKERGHIGTELQRKCCDMLQVKKVEIGNEGSGIFRYDVTMPRTRHKPIRGFSFDIDDQGIPQYINTNPVNPDAKLQKPILDIPSVIFGLLNGKTLSKAALARGVAAAINKSDSTAKKLIEDALRDGTIHQDRDNKQIAWGPDPEEYVSFTETSDTATDTVPQQSLPTTGESGGGLTDPFPQPTGEPPPF